MRCFLAFEIKGEIKDRIYDYLDEKGLSRIRGFGMVKRENLHITLKFLGEQKDDIASSLVFLSRLAQKIPEGERTHTVRGIGGFGPVERPAVLFAGVDDENGTLARFFDEAEKALTLALPGLKPECRKFSPHITLARNRKGSRIPEGTYTDEVFGTQYISSVVLFSSILKPEGPVYEKIEEYR